MINTTEKFEQLRNEADDNTIEALYMLNDYRGSTYICDAISERADSNVDVYNYDLIEWAKSHIAEIDEAAEELGKPDSFIGYIQQAQFIVNERNLYEGLEKAIVLHAWELASERVKEVTEEQAEKLDAMDLIIDNNNRVEDIEIEVLDILGVEE